MPVKKRVGFLENLVLELSQQIAKLDQNPSHNSFVRRAKNGQEKSYSGINV